MPPPAVRCHPQTTMDAVREDHAGQIPTANLLEHEPKWTHMCARSGNIKRCCCYSSRTQRVGVAGHPENVSPRPVDATSVFGNRGTLIRFGKKVRPFAHPPPSPSHSNDISNSPVRLFLKLVTRQITQRRLTDLAPQICLLCRPESNMTPAEAPGADASRTFSTQKRTRPSDCFPR
jgi:hypothetical protein